MPRLRRLVFPAARSCAGVVLRTAPARLVLPHGRDEGRAAGVRMSADRLILVAVFATVGWLYGYGHAQQARVDTYRAECVKLGGRWMATYHLKPYCVAHADTLYAGPKP